MATTTRIVCVTSAVVLFAILVVAIVNSPHRPTGQVAFSCLSVSNSSNACLITIGITNRSTSTIVYYVGPPQLQSNGVWSAAQFPLGTRLTQLGAGQSGTVIVTTPLASGESRVPVLWGFTYLASSTRWQEMREDVIEWFRMRNFRGRGALYTNYVTGIRL
jgi:hypothetical protein